MDSRSNEIIEVNPPEGLTLEKIRPLLKDPDPESAALAGYLLATLGDPSGLDLLLRYWREHAHADEDWIRLVYRAVAALGDDGRVSLLEKIYGGFRQDEHYQLREFYWTIRAIDGPNALKLRKQIRKEVGMDNLR
jgi:hypothetical protein